MNAPDPKAARAAAIAAAIDRVRAIEAEQGVTRAALQAIMAELLALAGQEALFPPAEFPPPPAGEKRRKTLPAAGRPGSSFRALYQCAEPGQ